jgi:hypothetical protein
MSATEAVKAARAAGIHLGVDGGDLVLEAPARPPADVLGAYAYGKTGAASGLDPTAIRQGRHRKARNEWLALIPEAHEGYVSWERAEAIRKMVQ